jgi:hypothetical protein
LDRSLYRRFTSDYSTHQPSPASMRGSFALDTSIGYGFAAHRQAAGVSAGNQHPRQSEKC